MLLELVILLSIANIVFAVLIMKKLGRMGFEMPKMSKKAQIKEAQPEPEPEPQPGPEKITTRIKEKLHLTKKTKAKKHVSEMPDMNRVISELESEFKRGRGKKKRKKKGEIAERLEEIEKS